MIRIGVFTRTANGFEGRLRTLSLDVALVLVPAEPSEADNAPDWRVRLAARDAADEPGLEVGAAWSRSGERAGDYLAVQLDDPVLLRPIRANLFRAPGEAGLHNLIWTRPPKPEKASRAKHARDKPARDEPAPERAPKG